MDKLTTALTALALESFDPRGSLDKLEETLKELNLTRSDLLSGAGLDRVRTGAWTPCRTCSDPGPDDFPDDEDRALG